MVVEKGGFSTAAEALHITQPTISARIQSLEQELQTALFNRISGKRAILTPAGEKILPYYQTAYQLITKTRDVLKDTNYEQNEFVIACPNHMGDEILTELLKGLYKNFPDIELPVKVSTTKNILEEVHNGKVDLGFAYLQSSDEHKDHKDLKFVHIAEERNILVCAPDHPLTNKGIISASELNHERIITYSKTFLTTKFIEQYLHKLGLKDRETLEIKNLGWLKMMVRKGLGVAFLSEMIVSDELRTHSLVELPLNEPLPAAPLYLVFGQRLREDIRLAAVDITRNLFARHF